MVCIEQYVYLYGVFYDSDRVSRPSPSTHDIIVYTNVHDETRSIGTVLGLFYTVRPLDVKDGNGLICSREQMPNFEDKHVGRFVPLG